MCECGSPQMNNSSDASPYLRSYVESNEPNELWYIGLNMKIRYAAVYCRRLLFSLPFSSFCRRLSLFRPSYQSPFVSIEASALIPGAMTYTPHKCLLWIKINKMCFVHNMVNVLWSCSSARAHSEDTCDVCSYSPKMTRRETAKGGPKAKPIPRHIGRLVRHITLGLQVKFNYSLFSRE